MTNLEYVTESFESKLHKNTAIVHLKRKALEILTDPHKNVDFYNLLKSVNDSPEVQGYVQINDFQFDGHRAVDVMVQFMSQDKEYFEKGGRYYGLRYEMIADRFRNSIGRYLLAMTQFEKRAIAGFEGKVSSEYLGLTLVFDSRIATTDTTFSFNNESTGLPASPGITELMPRYIGIGRTMSLVQSGATIDAQEALSLGLISAIVNNQKQLVDRCVEVIHSGSGEHPFLTKYHRQQILPSVDEISAALERYYEIMPKAVIALRDKS